MKLFPPGPVALGIAEAVLRDVSQISGSGEAVARYGLTPTRVPEFIDRIGGLRSYLNRRYEPIPGIWSSFVVPEERDEIELLIGLTPQHGMALTRAHKDLKSKAGSVVSPLALRTLALGYLARAGV